MTAHSAAGAGGPPAGGRQRRDPEAGDAQRPRAQAGAGPVRGGRLLQLRRGRRGARTDRHPCPNGLPCHRNSTLFQSQPSSISCRQRAAAVHTSLEHDPSCRFLMLHLLVKSKACRTHEHSVHLANLSDTAYLLANTLASTVCYCIWQVRHFDLREPSNGSRRLLHCRSGGRRSLRVRTQLPSAVQEQIMPHQSQRQTVFRNPPPHAIAQKLLSLKLTTPCVTAGGEDDRAEQHPLQSPAAVAVRGCRRR